MWRVGLAVVLVVGVLGVAPDALARSGASSSGGGVQSDGSGGGQVVAFSFEVTTTSASGGSDGGTTTSSSSSGGADVQPTCWYEPKKTGREMAAGRRGAADKSGLSRLILPDEEAASAHADDNGGRWYQVACDVSTDEGRRLSMMLLSANRWYCILLALRTRPFSSTANMTIVIKIYFLWSTF